MPDFNIKKNNNIVIDNFFESKICFHNDFHLFENAFKDYLVVRNGRKCYILDELSNEHKCKFLNLYGTSGGSTLYSNMFCDDNRYRVELWSHRFIIIWLLYN